MVITTLEYQMSNKTVAKFLYEQCAGTTSGHMANVPNNPVLFSLLSQAFDGKDNCHACSQTEFAEFLREAANQLTS